MSTEQQVNDLIKNRRTFFEMEPASLEKAIAINDFIYCSEGTSNAYMVVTDAGRVIINTGMGFEALHHKKLFDEVCSEPTAYILLTQGHVDHVGGVGHFRETGQPDKGIAKSLVIAQQNNAACQRDDERIAEQRQSQSYIWFQKTIDYAIKTAEDNPDALIQDKPVPDVTFDEQYCFSLGGIDFELYATPGGETIDSCIVWLPQHKILFSGNTFGPLFPHFPNINTIRGDKYRYMEPYLQSLQLVRELQPETLITGHFEPIQGQELITACLNRLEKAVSYVHKETLRGINAGTDIYTLMQTVRLPADYEVGEGYGKVSWAVRTIWESYMGWFKARQTSELFDQEPVSAYAELVELAGVDRVVNSGYEKLFSNQLEKALIIVEALQQHSPDNPVVRALARAVFEKLVERVGDTNFWEKGWLDNRLAQINAKLK